MASSNDLSNKELFFNGVFVSVVKDGISELRKGFELSSSSSASSSSHSSSSSLSSLSTSTEQEN